MNDPKPPECDHCGACCKSLIIEIGHVDVVREPRLLAVAPVMKSTMIGDGVPANPWEREYLLAAGVCPMHENDRCSIHPTRPNVCVGFEAGSADCQRARFHSRIAPLGRDRWPDDVDELSRLIGEE